MQVEGRRVRIRCIKPEFWISESVGRISREARLLFVGLWSFADDSGRGRGAFPAVSGALFPYDVDALSRLPGWFAELEVEGMVFRYKAEDGNTYYQIPNWLKHQRIEKPSASKIPEFSDSSQTITRLLPEASRLDQGSGIRDQGRDIAPASPDAKEKAPPKPREPNPAFDALCEVAGLTGKLTPREASRIGMSLKQIRTAMGEAELPTVAVEIRHRAENYRKTWPGMTLTDTALVAHWSKMEQGGTGPRVPRNSSEELAMMAENRK